jgi:hypothetical protein
MRVSRRSPYLRAGYFDGENPHMALDVGRKKSDESRCQKMAAPKRKAK